MGKNVMANTAPNQQHQIIFQPNFVFELADKAHTGIDGAGSAARQLAKSSALRAFRATVTLTGSHLPHPAMNASGNLRGMVISKRARQIYNISSNLAEKFDKYERALALASIIIEIGKESQTIYHLANSEISTGEKVRQSVLIVSTAVLRSVTSVVPGGAHLIAKSLEGYCQIAGLVSGGRLPTDKWVGALRRTDIEIKTAHQRIYSPDFLQHAGDAAFDMIYIHLHLN
jgi:hypothetical protein